MPAPVTSPCDFEKHARSVWGIDTQAEVNLPIKILDGKLQAQEAEMVATEMDRFTEEWVNLRESACRAHLVEKTLDKDGYEANVDCMESALATQSSIVHALKIDDKSAIDSAATLVDSLKLCAGTGTGESDDIEELPTSPPDSDDSGSND